MNGHDAPAPQLPVIHEPVAEPAPTELVARVRPEQPGRPARWRWAVALLVVALVATVSFAGGVLLTGARTSSTVAQWAPPDALAYGELRPDLPGDQRDQLAAFLSAFPGFSDRSILERKLTEIYDRLLSDATKGKQTYSADIAPWFGGELGVGIGVPPVRSGGASSEAARQAPMLMIASSSDSAKAIAWFRSSATDAGATLSTAESGGVQVVVASTSEGERIAAAAPAGVLLVGDEPSVRAAVARGGSGGLAADPSFRAALAALPADGLATAYVHTAAYADLLTRFAAATGTASPSVDLGPLLPAWSAATLRATSDALTADGAAPKTAAAAGVTDGPSALPARLPSTTIALADVHDAGAMLLAGLDALGSARKAELEQSLKPVGGVQALAGWVGEAAGVVLSTPDGPLPGVVATATDVKAAGALGGSLANLATLAGLRPVDESYAGRTITTVDLTSLAKEMAATAPSGPAAGSAKVPSHVAVSWTIADDLVVVGPDPAFVKAVLDTKPGASLADSARYRAMVGRVAGSNHALVWADVAALRDAMAARIPASDRSRYQTEIAPYLAPLSGVVGAATFDGSLMRTHGLLIVQRP